MFNASVVSPARPRGVLSQRGGVCLLGVVLLVGACADNPLSTLIDADRLPALQVTAVSHHHTLTALGDSVHLDTPREPIPGTPGSPGFWGHPNNPSQPCPWQPGHKNFERCIWNPGTPGTPGNPAFVRLTNLNPAILRLNELGWAVALGEGVGRIQRERETGTDTITILVELPPPSPPPGGEWDRILADTLIVGEVLVPSGETWLIGSNVRVAGNVRTIAGTIAMRPGSSLQFLGADPQEYVGGGMTYEPQFVRDIGLWVGHMGVLDIRGTPKTGWNRTGVDPTWIPTDEYWIAPTATGDHSPRRWYPGQSIPRIDARVPSTEVINVTRDILIEGPAHIHIHSHRPQRIEYVTLRRMGISNTARGTTTGRYALHLHHGGEGMRGTVIRGVAAVESGGRVFVPHSSHGITLIDNVSVNSFAEAFWWDPGDLSDDVVVERLAVSGVYLPAGVVGSGSQRAPGVFLGLGNNTEIRNSAVSGARNGFDWQTGIHGPIVWRFEENVTHNNTRIGLRLWFNNSSAHVVARTVTYRNGLAGIVNGAYRNSNRYVNTLSVDDRILHHASSRPQSGDGGPGRFDQVRVYASSGPAIRFSGFQLPALDRTEFLNCTLEAGPGAPKILVESRDVGNPLHAVFRNCGLTPDDIHFTLPMPAGLAGTSILVEHEGGTRWEVTLDIANQQKVVRILP